MDCWQWQWQSYRCSRPRFLVLRPSQQVVATKSRLEDEVATCAACKVTIHQHGGGGGGGVGARLSAVCPFCGQPYTPARLDGPVAAGVGAGRVRSHRSSNDPLVGSLRLPPIESDDVGGRRLSSIMVGRLGTMDIAELLLRPGSETSLPPIHKDPEPLKLTSVSRRSTPESGLRSALSMETVVSDLEEPRVTPRYPTRHKTREDFLQDVRRAHHSENYIGIQRFYMRCFDTFAEICALFKVDKDGSGARLEDPGLKMEFIYAVHDAVRTFPSIVHKTVLKSIINALLEENRVLHPKDDVRALFVLIQNPVFAAQSSYTIFAHLLRQIVELQLSDHQLLVHWFKLFTNETKWTQVRIMQQL